MEQPRIRIYRATDDEAFEFVFRIRREVFQTEMALDEEDDLDGNDHIAQHYLALWEGRPVGTSRWRITPGGRVNLERIAVGKPWRGRGIGTALVRTMLRDVPRGREIFLETREDTRGFYEKLGFQPEGEMYDWKGTPFQKMVWQG